MKVIEDDVVEKPPPVTVAPLLPLGLLESLRSHDRPREILEDEDLTASLPRRFGLTGVVDSQIRRYQQAVRKGEPVPLEEVENLLRLVLKRPDAEAILREAGQRVARAHFRRVPSAAVAALRVLPAAAALASLRRSTRSLLRRIVGAGTVHPIERPLDLRITAPLTAAVDESGTACVFYTAALEELLWLYTGRRQNMRHTRCAARGDEACEWTLPE